jgi:hypothetical protein
MRERERWMDVSGHLFSYARESIRGNYFVVFLYMLVPDTISINVGCSQPCAVNKPTATVSTQWDVAACNDVD